MEQLNIAFEFRGRMYDARVHVKGEEGQRAYNVSIIDKALDALLKGNELIQEFEGGLQANVEAAGEDQTALKLVITASLGRQLHKPCFAGDACLQAIPHEEGWEELHPIPRHQTGLH